jgi:hypothetical protein
LKIAERTLQKEREKFPLLQDWIAAQQPTPEERLETFQNREADRIQRERDYSAQTWRRARQLLRLLPPETKDRVLENWNTHHCPGDASYFADCVFQAARPLIDAGIVQLADPKLDPRYRIEQMLAAALAAKLQRC